jgi:hypothetical protein
MVMPENPSLKRVLKPIETFAVPVLSDRYNIKTTGFLGDFFAALQVVFGARPQSRLFAGVDGFGGSAEVHAAPEPHFHEYYGFLLLQDQVDFAEGAAVVALE